MALITADKGLIGPGIERYLSGLADVDEGKLAGGNEGFHTRAGCGYDRQQGHTGLRGFADMGGYV